MLIKSISALLIFKIDWDGELSLKFKMMIPLMKVSSMTLSVNKWRLRVYRRKKAMWMCLKYLLTFHPSYHYQHPKITLSTKQNKRWNEKRTKMKRTCNRQSWTKPLNKEKMILKTYKVRSSNSRHGRKSFHKE